MLQIDNEMSDVLKQVIDSNVKLIVDAERSIKALLKRRTVEIISNFNDQLYGKSKKSLKGRRFIVDDSSVDQGRVTVFMEGVRCGAWLWEDVVLVENSKEKDHG
jgi:hypothetical protein